MRITGFDVMVFVICTILLSAHIKGELIDGLVLLGLLMVAMMVVLLHIGGIAICREVDGEFKDIIIYDSTKQRTRKVNVRRRVK